MIDGGKAGKIRVQQLIDRVKIVLRQNNPPIFQRQLIQVVLVEIERYRIDCRNGAGVRVDALRKVRRCNGDEKIGIERHAQLRVGARCRHVNGAAQISIGSNSKEEL